MDRPTCSSCDWYLPGRSGRGSCGCPMITTLDMKPGDLVWLGQWDGKRHRYLRGYDAGPVVDGGRVWPSSTGGWYASGPAPDPFPTRAEAEAEAERALLAYYGITAPAPADLAGLAAREAT